MRCAARSVRGLTWHRPALAVVGLLAAVLMFTHLDQTVYPNPYYAAAVQSMLTSWHTFFFASVDAGGFVALDKPPLGFWTQAASAALLGFHPLSLILPQALAGLGAIALLDHLVRRVYGPVAGLLAALALALTPITGVTARNNTIDSLLVLTMLLAAWAASRATETGRLRPLLLCAALVGLGFNIKMLEAYLVVPACGLLYLATAPRPRRTRVVHLALAALVVLAVSLWWVTAVDLTPAAQRPFVGSTSTNSELGLVVGHNGLSILRDTQNPAAATGGPAAAPAPYPIGFEVGPRGPLRLLDVHLAGQVSWLLPLALFGLVAAARQTRWPPRDRPGQALVLWGSWLLTQLVFFSVVGFFHPYYLVILAPAISALAGIGAVALWQEYRRRGQRGGLLPLAVAGTMAVQALILAPFPAWSRWLLPLLAGAVLGAVGLLLLGRRVQSQTTAAAYRRAAVALTLLAVLSAPATWGGIASWAGRSNMFPIAGPDALRGRGTLPPHIDPVLWHYLAAQRGHTRYLLAVSDAETAAPLILATGQPVLALHGTLGQDHILSPTALARLAADGVVRFVLLPPSSPDPLDRWIQGDCPAVPAMLWQAGPGGPLGASTLDPGDSGALQLYDCAPTRPT